MLQTADPLVAAIGFVPAVIYVLAKALIAVMLWGVAIIGFLRIEVAWWERFWALAAASTLVLALPITDEIGWAAAIAFFAWHFWRARQAAAQPKPAE